MRNARARAQGKKPRFLESFATAKYRLTLADARPHLTHDFSSITIFTFEAIEAYIHI